MNKNTYTTQKQLRRDVLTNLVADTLMSMVTIDTLLDYLKSTDIGTTVFVKQMFVDLNWVREHNILIHNTVSEFRSPFLDPFLIQAIKHTTNQAVKNVDNLKPILRCIILDAINRTNKLETNQTDLEIFTYALYLSQCKLNSHLRQLQAW